jgi:hypothetical protein
MSPLTAWTSFYVIMGSSAGALTGLTFVVITLTPDRRPENASWGVGTFTTPTIVHFGVVLFVSALLSAPWPALWQPGVLLGFSGLAGMGYFSIIVRRLRRWPSTSYQPVREDWEWFALLPLAAYGALLIAAVLLPGDPVPALFIVGGVLLLLLFIGIHNAWDVVTWIAIENPGRAGTQQEQNEPDEQREPSGEQTESKDAVQQA